MSGILVPLATITSRVEALVVASMLEHTGVRVWIDGVHHASVDPRGPNEYYLINSG